MRTGFENESIHSSRQFAAPTCKGTLTRPGDEIIGKGSFSTSKAGLYQNVWDKNTKVNKELKQGPADTLKALCPDASPIGWTTQ